VANFSPPHFNSFRRPRTAGWCFRRGADKLPSSNRRIPDWAIYGERL